MSKTVTEYFKHKFELMVSASKKEVFRQLSMEEVFNEIFPRWKILQEFGLLDKEADVFAQSSFKILFGIDWYQYIKLAEKISRENVCKLSDSSYTENISGEEYLQYKYWNFMTKFDRIFSEIEL